MSEQRGGDAPQANEQLTYAQELKKRLSDPKYLQDEEAYKRAWLQEAKHGTEQDKISWLELYGELIFHKVDKASIDPRLKRMLHGRVQKILDVAIQVSPLSQNSKTRDDGQRIFDEAMEQEDDILSDYLESGFRSWLSENITEIKNEVEKIRERAQELAVQWNDPDRVKRSLDRQLPKIYQSAANIFIREQLHEGDLQMHEEDFQSLINLAHEIPGNFSRDVSHFLRNLSLFYFRKATPSGMKKMAKIVEETLAEAK